MISDYFKNIEEKCDSKLEGNEERGRVGVGNRPSTVPRTTQLSTREHH